MAYGPNNLGSGLDITKTTSDLNEESARRTRVNNLLAACYIYRNRFALSVDGDDEFDLLDVLGIEGEDRELGVYLAQTVDHTP